MQLVTLSLDHVNFFCPVTGHRMVGHNYYESSPALLGAWVSDVASEPQLENDGLTGYWNRYLNALDDEYDIDLNKFFESVEEDCWVCFEITTGGMACGPVWTTVWYVIDMNYEVEEVAV